MRRVTMCRDARSRRVTLCRDARSVRPLSNQPTSNGCRDARSSVRCVKARRVTVVGTHDLCVRCVKSRRVAWCRDARPERPLYQIDYAVTLNGDGRHLARHYRASLQRVTLDSGICEKLRLVLLCRCFFVTCLRF